MKKTPSWADDRAFGRHTGYSSARAHSSARAQRAVDVNWIRNPDGNWYLLDELPRVLPSLRCDGIYILWYFDESHVPQTVRVGIKGVNDNFGMLGKDRQVEKYTVHPLYITWAEVKPPPAAHLRRQSVLYHESVTANKQPSLDYLRGIWSYLCEKLEPLAGPRCPQSDSIPVILPWASD